MQHSEARQAWLTYTMGGAGALLLIGAIVFSVGDGGGATFAEAAITSEGQGEAKAAGAQEKPEPLKAVEMPECNGAEHSAAPRTMGNPQAREAAQKGLDFLAKEARAWQTQHKCYGCHVQAVTVEALTVGHHHQYRVDQDDFSDILDGMLTQKGGARTEEKLGHSSPSIAQAARILGGAAFARYDAKVNTTLQDDLLMVAKIITEYQQPDGSVVVGWNSAPVATGVTQSTAQAMIVWKQAYERTADDQWLTAVQRSEDYLHGVISGWKASPPGSIQEINYAIMGLLAAGTGNTEELMVDLSKRLLSLQGPDGSWDGSVSPAKGTAAAPAPMPEPNQVAPNVVANRAPVRRVNHTHGRLSQAFATGQTLYTLRMLGLTDRDVQIAKGTDWLIKHQLEDGGWSHEGFGKAEAMWAVLGLVSTDVLTIASVNLKSGQHIDGQHTFEIKARDNQGAGVKQIEVLVDDVRVKGHCGGELSVELDTARLDKGKHLITVAATNARGEVSRRVFEVFTGDFYLTQIGSRFEQDGTAITMRDIAPTSLKHHVEVEIHTLKADATTPTADKLVKATRLDGDQGALRYFWNGHDEKDAPLPRGKYLARITLRDAEGRARHSEEVVFVHDTLEAQRAAWAEVNGSLDLEDGEDAANTLVELVDDEGNVVQRSWSTNNGNYRFRNVDTNRKYKVRVSKSGFKAVESKEFAPAPAAEAPVQQDMLLEAE